MYAPNSGCPCGSVKRSSVPGVLRWEDATAAQIAQATTAAARHKSPDLLIALMQVPAIDPVLKMTVIRKIQTACKVGEHRAKEALNELIVKGKVDEVLIPNPNNKRRFAGVVRHP
jgi:hypothetical protein